MWVGEHDGVECVELQGRSLPVAKPELLDARVEAAVHEDPGGVGLH